MEKTGGPLFVACLLVKEQWDRILRLSSTQKLIIPTILIVALWCIWLLRNKIKEATSIRVLEYKYKRVSLENIASSVLPTLLVKDESFLIYDEKYAAKLQLQEALLQSESQINTSRSSASSQKDLSSSSSSDASSTSSSQNDASSSSVSSIPATSTTLALKMSESFCNICMDIKAPSEMFSNAKVCSHLYCSDCIREHVSVKIKENIVSVKCPDPTCKGLIGPEICRSIVPKEVLERWEDALCESLILGTQKFYCPFKDCSAMLVDDGGEAVTSAECPNCHRLFCAQCKVAWHSGVDCSEFQSLKGNPEDIMLMQLAKNKKWRRCPSCNFVVEKKDGCNQITCRCGYQFCYGCGKKHWNIPCLFCLESSSKHCLFFSFSTRN